MMPLDIQANARRINLMKGFKPPPTENLKKWQVRWNEKGPLWTRAIIPKLTTWTNRRHGELGSALTEALTGHGTFLKLTKKRNDSSCPYCNTPETVRHALLHCPRYDEERIAAGLQHAVNPMDIAKTMLDSRAAWKAVEKLANKIRANGMAQ